MRISDWSSDVCSSDLQAPNRVDDDRAVQRHPVVGPGLVAPLGQPEFIERRIEQIARIIAGERPPGAIRALLARREPDDREPRVWEIGRASGRERACSYVYIWVVAVS